ncbi:DUF2147 domain-containing protein [Sphingobacterium spiritivorum]|uniref:DUF2147 domain-containing protein n=2 Tax=Sphingobacterium spiritivorum TaxID=258 RepID=D7VII2_SPHSI|nr:DUF2147 domain-containing protein [Sphingobacterium spiritivorum]EFK59884.1 hypothetical protein HMPREF0766_10801 [Sphingobacterium spiritivorum ATCC 33861]QQT37477.1 DUF2147 domain-containing protein [Sphingobacterium spiritivorum]WQD34272.1 DUF2147 domain-containing protein [Sphingobacterium spiritivorum]SUI97097.1 Uncharacterized protein conserved in bacteria [Sphingobacterium spiritivorum]SUJ14137.1 Uncharacterized protein conserved in bacteria [Sphingobacterium spiritivorum]
MKKLMLSLMVLFVTVALFAQTDPVIGKWQNPSGEARVEIYKKGDKFYGKIYWLKTPNDESGHPKKDVKNPDDKLKSRPVLGMENLTNFEKVKDNLYENGKVYDPKSGKTYSCKMTLKGDKLDIRGYVGVSLIGRTDTFTRVK